MNFSILLEKTLLFSDSPWNFIVISFVTTLFLIFSVILFGFLTYLFEKIEIAILKKIFGLKFAIFFSNYFTFPGIFVHELSHALFCVLTGAKLKEICIFENHSERLGHISYSNRGPFLLRAIQDSLIAAAPTIIGSSLLYFLFFTLFTKELNYWQILVILYSILSLLNHSSMSSVDRSAYLKNFWILLIPVFTIIFVYLHFFQNIQVY